MFAISFVGVLDLFFNLWDYESQKCKYPKEETKKPKSETNPKQEQAEGGINKDTKTVTHNHEPTPTHDEK